MMTLLGADPNLMQQAGDLIFRNMDFPGAEIIADRLAAANPLAQIDDKSDIPPQAQMLIQQGQATIQQLQQQIQALNMDIQYGASVKEQQEKAATLRKAMDIEGKRKDTELRTETQAHDTVIKTETQKEIEQLKAQLALVLAQLDLKDLHTAEAEAIERGI
jgi:hypothetical protein